MRKTSIFRRQMKLMGSHFEISVVAGEEAHALEWIRAGAAEIQRIENLLTTYEENSETNQVNRQAGIAPVAVSRETFDLIERSIRISAITQGAFDITYGSADRRFWNFNTDMQRLPDPKVAREMVRLINYRNVLLDKAHTTVFLKEKGMRIGFGGIGKGYAAERAKLEMQKMGNHSGLVNASGDLTAWGYQPDGTPWTIGISNPDDPKKVISLLNITDMAIATSGNYEKYVVIDGKKYSHTIDPRTGWPVTGIKSVTIICPNAEIADAMATPVMIMGIGVGLDMINQIDNMEAIIIDDENNVYASDNIILTQT